MWLILNEYINKNDNFLLMIGKSLFLCQKFEGSCKEIIMWLNLSKAIQEDKFKAFSNEHKNYVEKLLSLFLGKSINLLKNNFEISQSDFEILNNAKESRNFIAHESTEKFISCSMCSKDYFYKQTDFEKHIINIAEGDYLVSKWSYEFCEKESGDFFDKNKYIKNILNWINL